jgi:hypothetical protein
MDKDGNDNEVLIWQAWVKSQVPDGPINYVGAGALTQMLTTEPFKLVRPDDQSSPSNHPDD